MMARIRHGIEYLSVLLFLGWVRLTPIRCTPWLARFTGRLSHLCTPKRVEIALENLRSVFPQATSKSLKQIIKALYFNLAGNAIDEARLDSLADQVPIPAAAERRLAEIASLSASGRPLILVSAHFGAWEVLGVLLASRFPNIHILAKEQRNKLVDRLLSRLRLKRGGYLIRSHEAPRLLSRLFKNPGAMLLFIGDQDGGPDGVLIDFLGRPTSYARGMALYSYHYNAPVIPIFLHRCNPGFALDFAEPIEPNLTAAKEQEVRRIITAYSDALAERVLKNPEQWLWTHRRWKSTPLTEAGG